LHIGKRIVAGGLYVVRTFWTIGQRWCRGCSGQCGRSSPKMRRIARKSAPRVCACLLEQDGFELPVLFLKHRAELSSDGLGTGSCRQVVQESVLAVRIHSAPANRQKPSGAHRREVPTRAGLTGERTRGRTSFSSRFAEGVCPTLAFSLERLSIRRSALG